MMYCPRCNNTHWVTGEPRGLLDNLSWLVLRRRYRCIKCDHSRFGSVFLDFQTSKPLKPKRKIARDRKDITELRCPECGGENIRRSRRRGFERLLLFSRAYRCAACEVRFRTIKVV